MAVKLPDGSKATTDIQAKSFRQEFEVWERKAEGLTGDTIGMISPEASGMSLLDLVKNQGISGRVKGKVGTKIKGKGGVQIFKALKTIFNSPSMSPEQEKALKALDSIMEELKQTLEILSFQTQVTGMTMMGLLYPVNQFMDIIELTNMK